MMISPNSHVRQKEEDQEEEEEAGGERKGGPTGTPSPGAGAPIFQLGQGYRMQGTGENMDDGVGFQSTRWAEGARDQSYPLTIGMEGAIER